MFFQRYSPGQVVFEISGIVYTQVQIKFKFKSKIRLAIKASKQFCHVLLGS